MPTDQLADLIEKNEVELLDEWAQQQVSSITSLKDRISESEIRTNAHDFLMALRQAIAQDGTYDIANPAYSGLRDNLADLSRQWVALGFTPSETASFVFSFKEALFGLLRTQVPDPKAQAEQILASSRLLDKLGLYTTEVFQSSRENIINRQQQDMLELSTPVVELWSGILALPLIGTLDSARTQIVMQNLLEALVAKNATIAIVDITGVPTVDTLVAQHLLKTVAAARLMGAECIISGIRPQIAQTIIHLGVDLGGIITKANLADAFRIALQKQGLAVVKRAS